MDFNTLVKLHKLIVNSDGTDLRPALKDEEIQIINDSLVEMNREYDNIDELLPDLFRFGGLVFLIQPFYDANKRTTILMYRFITRKKGFDIDFESMLKDNEFINLTPVFYNVHEMVSESFMRRVGQLFASNLRQQRNR